MCVISLIMYILTYVYNFWEFNNNILTDIFISSVGNTEAITTCLERWGSYLISLFCIYR